MSRVDLPAFPEFKPVEISDRLAVERVTRCYAPYSDFNFTSIYSYDTDRTTRLSTLNGNLVLRCSDYVTGEPFYSFLGRNAAMETIMELLHRSEAEGIPRVLRMVPGASLEGLPGASSVHLSVSEDPSSADYLLSTVDVATLAGPERRSKRRSTRAFRRSFPDVCIREIDLGAAETCAEIHSVLDAWQAKRSREPGDTRREFGAIDRILGASAPLALRSYGAFDGDRMVGFTINEIIHGGFYMAHFGKADPEYHGLGVVLESATAARLAEDGCHLMNFQQDLGIAGLRRYKRSWHPVDYLRKYSVSDEHSQGCPSGAIL